MLSERLLMEWINEHLVHNHTMHMFIELEFKPNFPSVFKSSDLCSQARLISVRKWVSNSTWNQRKLRIETHFRRMVECSTEPTVTYLNHSIHEILYICSDVIHKCYILHCQSPVFCPHYGLSRFLLADSISIQSTNGKNKHIHSSKSFQVLNNYLNKNWAFEAFGKD